MKASFQVELKIKHYNVVYRSVYAHKFPNQLFLVFYFKVENKQTTKKIYFLADDLSKENARKLHFIYLFSAHFHAP